jgi:hypothetical protein
MWRSAPADTQLIKRGGRFCDGWVTPLASMGGTLKYARHTKSMAAVVLPCDYQGYQSMIPCFPGLVPRRTEVGHLLRR